MEHIDEHSIPYGHQEIDESDIQAVVEVLRGEWLTTGPAVTRFEAALGEVVDSPCVAVSSGTAALHTAYAAAGLGPGDELVTTPLSFAATASAGLHLGARIVFADIEDGSLNLDPRAVDSAITGRTKAVTAVDFAGQPGRIESFSAIARKASALFIEDAAHSIGGLYRGKPIGSIADLTTFSFHPVKTITTAEGGAVASPHAEFLARAREFRNHGLVSDPRRQRRPQGPWHQEVQQLGLNYRMPDVLAALGVSQLSRLQSFKERRAELALRYRQALSDVPQIRFQDFAGDSEPAWHLFVVRILDGRRREIFDALRSKGIGVQVHYLPIYLHPVYEDLGYRQGMCPVAERAYHELLSLPLFPGLTAADQDRVIAELRAALGVP